jgi:cell division protein FtsQ
MTDVAAARRKRDEKLRVTRRKQMAWIVVVALSLAVVGLLGYFVLNSDFWLVKTVSVSGNRQLPAEKVVELTGVGHQANLIKLSKSRVEAGLRREPRIREVRLIKRLPNRLEVRIVERRPFVGIKQGDKVYLLDSTGFVIEILGRPAGETIPVITEMRSVNLKVGKRTRSKRVLGAIASLKQLSPDIRKKVIWISVPSLDKLTFVTSDPLEIIFGLPDESDKKNLVIKKILADSDGKIIHINVSVPTNPIVRKLKI